MSLEIKVPVFPESVADGTLVTWHKQPGESARRDEVIADIETDKVVFEVAALEDCVIKDCLIAEGATVQSGQLIATAEISVVAAVVQDKAPANLETLMSTNKVVGHDVVAKTIHPAAKKMLFENSIDPVEIKGSGKNGGIIKKDVIDFLKNVPTGTQEVNKLEAETRPTTEGATPANHQRVEKRVPMSRLRARIAERLLESQHNAAILTTFNEINMQAVMDLRVQYKDQFEKKYGVRLGFMSFFVKACIEALMRFPDVNASIEDKDIIYHNYYDLGIAVGSPRGLVVPVLRDADKLGFSAIEKKISAYAEAAKNSTLTIEDLQGGTFTLTNGGVFGSLLSTPIINPPQSAILGMHKIEKRAMVENDQVVIRPMMYVALSYDHRLIDGRGAVQFLVIIKDLLEEPARLLLEV